MSGACGVLDGKGAIEKVVVAKERKKNFVVGTAQKTIEATSIISLSKLPLGVQLLVVRYSVDKSISVNRCISWLMSVDEKA